MSETLKVANSYRNIDVRKGVPGGYTHVRGKRLGPLCRKLNIKFVQALVGFTDNGRFGYSPKLDGVVVSSRSVNKLFAEISARKERSANRKKPTRKQRAAARRRRQQRDIDHFAEAIRERFPSMPEGEEMVIARHACQIGSGRVGRSTVANDPLVAAVVAHVRHKYTDYEELLEQAKACAFDREEREELRRGARDQVRGQIGEVIERWQQPVEDETNDV